jgi:transglutaminase-like putative cysteine protease
MSAPLPLPDSIRDLIARGDFAAARAELGALAERAGDGDRRSATLFESERLRRLEREFSLTETETLERLRDVVPDTTPEDVARWRREGLLQSLVIEGERRIFRRDPGNLPLRSGEARERRVAAGLPAEPRRALRDVADDQRIDLSDHLSEAMATGGLCCPVRYRITHTVAVKPGLVPSGETIRCWLPIPRGEPHQTDFELLSSDPTEHILAPPDVPQRCVFLQREAEASGQSTVFQISHEFTAWASHTRVDPSEVEFPDPTDPEVQRFTEERWPFLFTPRIRQLTREIVGDESNPHLKAKRIFEWMDANIVWIGEREYSTITDFTGLCLDRHAGDCGVQAILFITLCRCAGVPARWESGWWIHPASVNMHDWARFLIRPHGWLWADLTKGHNPDQFRDPATARAFYFGGIDACRLVACADIAQPLTPPRRHPRSETLDFQRGEVEWDGGNLYFDEWDSLFEVQRVS